MSAVQDRKMSADEAAALPREAVYRAIRKVAILETT